MIAVLSFGVESLPFFSNYEILELQLHEGYLHQMASQIKVKYALNVRYFC